MAGVCLFLLCRWQPVNDGGVLAGPVADLQANYPDNGLLIKTGNAFVCDIFKQQLYEFYKCCFRPSCHALSGAL